MSDISLAVGDGARRMTYVELAEARGISLNAARRLTLRHRWPKHPGNDGLVRVSVPLSALAKPSKPATKGNGTSRPGDAVTDATSRRHDVMTDTASDGTSDPLSDATSDTTSGRAISALESAVEGLRDQLDIANRRVDTERERAAAEHDRADRAERQAHNERARADQAEHRIAALRAELSETKIGERAAAEHASAAAAQAEDLRRRLDAAEARAVALDEERRRLTDILAEELMRPRGWRALWPRRRR